MAVRAKAGDREAIEELFRGQYPLLKGFFLKMTADGHLAEDITQEAMLRALMSLGRYRPEAKFSTWLVAIGLNVYRNQLRGRRSRPLQETVDTGAGAAEAEDAIEAGMARREMAEMLASLPEEKRKVFLLKHVYGFKYEEIAGILGCPVGTVRSRLHDSVMHLRAEAVRRGLK